MYLFLILFFFPFLLFTPRQETLGELMRERSRNLLGWMEVLSPASNSFIKSNKLDRYAPAITVFFINKMESKGRAEEERNGERRKTETTFFFRV